MNHRTRRVLVVLPLAALCLLIFAALAFAAFHTTSNTYHGIGSSSGGGVGSGQPYAHAKNPLDVQAAMYHVYDNGTHNLQCNDGPKDGEAICFGQWGTAPCQKRAYTRSFSSVGQIMPWHWMRGASCAGQTHQ